MGPKGLVLVLIIRPDRGVVVYEDDAERFYRRPRTARLLEVARAL